MGYDREGYEADRDMQEEKERTKEAVEGIIGHLEHVGSRLELARYLEEQVSLLRVAALADGEMRKIRRSGGI